MAFESFHETFTGSGDILDASATPEDPPATDSGIGMKFTIGTTGTNESYAVSKVEIYMKKAGTLANDLIVEIREIIGGVVQSAVLGSTTIAKSTFAAGYAWINCGDMGHPFLEASHIYLLSVRSAGQSFGVNEYLWAFDGTTNYAGGGIYSSDDFGITWTANDQDVDLFFRITGAQWPSEIVSYPEIVAAVGAGASATALSFQYASNFVSNAEAFVNAVTRYDWTTNWSSITSTAKNIVKEAIITLAAAWIVDYDVKGYDSRFEAEYISLALLARSDRALATLLDENVKKFIHG
jgi:hypothetical protein